jgi:hypothetical protein
MQPSVPQKIARNGDSVNVLRGYLFHVNVALFGAALFYWAKTAARAVAQLNVTKDFQSREPCRALRMPGLNQNQMLLHT